MKAAEKLVVVVVVVTVFRHCGHCNDAFFFIVSYEWQETHKLNVFRFIQQREEKQKRGEEKMVCKISTVHFFPVSHTFGILGFANVIKNPAYFVLRDFIGNAASPTGKKLNIFVRNLIQWHSRSFSSRRFTVITFLKVFLIVIIIWIAYQRTFEQSIIYTGIKDIVNLMNLKFSQEAAEALKRFPLGLGGYITLHAPSSCMLANLFRPRPLMFPALHAQQWDACSMLAFVDLTYATCWIVCIYSCSHGKACNVIRFYIQA